MATTAPPKPAADSAANDSGWKPELHELPLDQITTGANVRSDLGDITDLAASIEAHGLEQPVRVVELGPRDGAPAYELVFGHRRLAAAQHIGLRTIPALVEPFASDGRNGVAGRVVRQLIENLQREDLNALDTAKAYRALLDAGMTQRALGEELGVAQPTIANTLRLLKAPAAIQERVAAGELTRSHVEAIAKLPASEQTEVARRISEHGLSVDQVTEELRLAEQRQSAEDRRRDQQRNRDQELLAGWLALLLKKKAGPETTTLVGWAGTPADGLAALAKRGWGRSRTAARGADQAWRAPAPKGCGCDAYELSYTVNWMSGGETYKPTITRACIVKAHQAAADKAEREARDAEQAEAAEIERRAVEERAAKLAPLVTAVTTPIPPTKAKLLLFALLGGGDSSGYWIANQWANRGLGYDGWRDKLWVTIDALPHEKLLVEIAQRVTEAVLEAGGKAHTAIEQLIADGPTPKAKKAAKVKG